MGIAGEGRKSGHEAVLGQGQSVPRGTATVPTGQEALPSRAYQAAKLRDKGSLPGSAVVRRSSALNAAIAA